MQTMTQLLIRRMVVIAFVLTILPLFDIAALAQKSNNDSRPGSVLFFNRYTSDANNPQLSDTQINISNTNPSETASVHLFFVDGTNGSNADFGLTLMPGQTLSFLTSEFDPGVAGYIIAVATDGSVPVQNNSLIGTALIRERDGNQVVLPAFTVVKVSPGRVARDVDDSVRLKFNGLEYEQLPGSLAVANFNRETADAVSLIVYSPAGDLISGTTETINIYSLLFDDAQRSIPSNFSVRGYRVDPLSAFFNRQGIVMRHSPISKRGWIRMSAGSRPMLGSIINRTTGISSGYNLPSLTLMPSYEIRLPGY
jgi:hypothetical protein